MSEDLGGSVTKRLCPGMAHAINQDEIDLTRRMMAELADPSRFC